MRGGAFSWPTQNADLSRDQNDASVLLKDAPQGDYTVETKLTIDLGEDTDRSYQQAGLVTYADDDNYTKLVHVAIGSGRRTEFAKEEAGAYGGMMVGPPAATTWLRISHHVDPDMASTSIARRQVVTASTGFGEGVGRSLQG